jgi:RecA/RadA recombinase
MSLAAKLMKSLPKNSMVSVLSESDYLDKGVVCSTDIPAINLLLSGKLDGGVIPGITQLVGDSRTFKSLFCLVAMSAYLKKYPDATAVFFDSELGSRKEYFESADIDMSRVIHIVVRTVEELKVNVVNILSQVEKNEKVFMFVDSISQLASNKEIDDAMNADVKVDLTRAKAINSLFRMITTDLSVKKVPFFCINSFYSDMANKYAEANIKGGKQIFLSSDTILMVSRSQEKVDGEFVGFNFNYNVMKSRFVQEKSKVSVTVTFDGGIDKESGLMEMARDGRFIDMPKSGWYTRTALNDGLEDSKSYRAKECKGEAFWKPILSSKAFSKYIEDTYGLSGGDLISSAETIIDEETGEIIDVV